MDDLKEIGGDLWRNKPLLIVVLLAVGIAAYVLIRNSQNQLAASLPAPSGQTSSGSGGGGTYVEESITYNITNPVQSPPVITPPVTTPPVTTPPVISKILLTIRQATSINKKNGQTSVPVKAQPGAGASIGSLKYGAVIQALGQAVMGEYNYPLSGGSGSNLWYPVSLNGKTGYVSAYDVGSVATS